MARRGRSSVPSGARRFAPPLALMGVIFFLSAQPDLDSGLGAADFVLRKLAHMTEYGVLWWLWRRALGDDRSLAAAAITLLYACSDEYHQTFVEGRHGLPRDVAVDAIGVAAAWLLTRRAAPAAAEGT